MMTSGIAAATRIDPPEPGTPADIISIIEEEAFRAFAAGTVMISRSTRATVNALQTILDFIETRFENPGDAFMWYRFTPIEAFCGRTASEIVQSGDVLPLARHLRQI